MEGAANRKAGHVLDTTDDADEARAVALLKALLRHPRVRRQFRALVSEIDRILGEDDAR